MYFKMEEKPKKFKSELPKKTQEKRKKNTKQPKSVSPPAVDPPQTSPTKMIGVSDERNTSTAELSLEKQPKSEPSLSKSLLAPQRTVCWHWKRGNCSRGDACAFLHPNREKGFKIPELCKYSESGHCLKGSDCSYLHDASKVPCRFFHVHGVCYQRDNCKFSHDPISKEVRARLIESFNSYHRYEKTKNELAVNLPPVPPTALPVAISQSTANTLDIFTPASTLPCLENLSSASREDRFWIEEAIKMYRPYRSPF